MYGVHAEHFVRKPEVIFKTPTYSIGGSNYSPARQGGFILLCVLFADSFVRITKTKMIKDYWIGYIGKLLENYLLRDRKNNLRSIFMKLPIRLIIPKGALTLNT